MKFNSVFE